VRALLLTIAILLSPTAKAVAPGVAGTLSIIPGLGQVSNGQFLEGTAWFVSSIGLFIQRNPFVSNVGFKLWEYNMYDAYRDAGAHNAAKYSAFENYIAFLNPAGVIDPVGDGILAYGTARTLTARSTASLGPKNRIAGAFYYGFVGFGEEGLFRGFLFPGFSDLLSSRWAGAIVSSLLFSASHLTNKDAYYHSVSGLGELFLLGMAFCWQTNNNGFDIRHGIFTHAWYDFIIDYVGKKADSHFPDTFGVKVTLPFH
jgi:membrane protease YdiL (CAAX protease family)